MGSYNLNHIKTHERELQTMHIKTVELFTFEELSDTAKERARDWLRELTFSDSCDWEHVIEDAKEIGALLGIDIDRVYFSGFSSQGDGACFEGSYSYAKGWRKALRAHVGGDDLKPLESIGEALQAIQQKYFYQIEASVKHRGHYMHEHCTDISVYVDGEYAPDNVEEDIKEALRDYMRWIYKSLEREHDYQMSDEVIEDNIIANEYTFNIDGQRED